MDFEYEGLTAPCPECGDETGTCEHTWGARHYNILILHGDGNHSRCHPASDCRG